MCTVLLRFRPEATWPVVLAAVRDEFADRAWDPPGQHWDGAAAGLVGGRDRVAGGTWLAVDPGTPAMAALLNGVRREVPPDEVRRSLRAGPESPRRSLRAGPESPRRSLRAGPESPRRSLRAGPESPRPSRGSLPLTALTGGPLPDPHPFDGFHLLRAGPDRVEAWTWDATALQHRELAPGDHIAVNAGIDPADHPLVSHFAPLLAALPDPDPRPGLLPAQAWGGWLRLLAGDGLDPADPRALVVRRSVEGRAYASTSASLLALRPGAVRYDFAGPPGPHARWWEVG